MTDSPDRSRRDALKCLGFGAGTVFTLSGGVLCATDLALAAARPPGAARAPFFVQISDSHIGFSRDANPDVNVTLEETIGLANALNPDFAIHTGDITHLSRPAEFDLAAQLLKGLNASELHTVPGEHDVTDGTGAEYFARYGAASANRGWYSFDARGAHFVALVNVMDFKAGGLGGLGADQIAWLKDDLAHRPASTPVVVFAHMPLWTIYAPWGWGTGDADQAFALLRRFGSVTVLNGHIHQIVQKVEGNMVFHTARSTAFPQPAAGDGPGPGPLSVPRADLARMLGLTGVTVARHTKLSDATLG
ncbi:MAG TPA: metallophosphoesterase [Rhizomicrobium sp.]|nr:metallophosphoesterase [Rhizomicrobium sp.]